MTRQKNILYPFWVLDVYAIKSSIQNSGRPEKLIIIDSWFIAANSTLPEVGRIVYILAIALDLTRVARSSQESEADRPWHRIMWAGGLERGL